EQSAHADEWEKKEPLPRWKRVPAGNLGAEPTRQIGRRIDPDKPRDDNHDDREKDRQDRLIQWKNVRAIEQRADLKTRHQENYPLEQINKQIPEEYALQSRGGGNEQRPVPADIEAGRHGPQTRLPRLNERAPERPHRASSKTARSRREDRAPSAASAG